MASFVRIKNKISYILEKIKCPSNVLQNVSQNMGVKLNKTQQEINNLISRNSHITYFSLAKEIKKSEETIRRNIKFLVENKLIERVGSSKSGYWKIIK